MEQERQFNRYRFFERLVYRSLGSQRFTQSSPIMPNVWIRFGVSPGERLPLLLTPHSDSTPGELAGSLREALKRYEEEAQAGERPKGKKRDRGPRIAYNQTVVAADLHFHELIRVASPLSVWWRDYLMHGAGREPTALFVDPNLRTELRQRILDAWNTANYTPKTRKDLTVQLVWMARVVGTIALVNSDPKIMKKTEEADFELDAEDNDRVVDALFAVVRGVVPPPTDEPKRLWAVNVNRSTIASVVQSTSAVKADATHRVFEVRGKGITWAVLDTGIDAEHLAFRERNLKGEAKEKAFQKKSVWVNNTRVKATYDFVHIRELLTGDTGELPDEVLERVTNAKHKDLKRIVRTGRVVNWDELGDWLRIPHVDGRYKTPKHPHGTHVAGIIGADWRPQDSDEDDLEQEDADVLRREDCLTGVAPEVELIDVRVLNDQGGADEFSLMAGMQFVRHLNAIHDERQVHGVNLSFSLRHNFSVFACGRTPVCMEVERLVGTGTVVVAAAGNEGMARFQVIDDPGGDYHFAEGNRSISITDPGNAEAAITVGATHRRDPHSYGVSYFSSRGPTGDGRKKPDLVAPGEKITSTWPNDTSGEMDGTSQAAPHVSGAAALLMARNPELVGQPVFVKKVICDTATDLGREPYFQGAGMLDILRALQSI